jgi:osmotically-inducible protein OsmY
VVYAHFDRQLAERLAAGIEGVEAIQNNIITNRVRPPKPDWQLLADIRAELFWSPMVDSEQVAVSVDSGVATLSGRVDSWTERKAAERNAREAGARRVRNRLELLAWK